MLAALDVIGDHVNELTRLRQELYSAAAIGFGHAWDDAGRAAMDGKLEVMSELLNTSWREEVIVCLSDAQKSLRDSAAIFRALILKYDGALRGAASWRISNSPFLDARSLDALERVIALAKSITERTSHLLDCIDSLRTAHTPDSTPNSYTKEQLTDAYKRQLKFFSEARTCRKFQGKSKEEILQYLQASTGKGKLALESLRAKR